MDSEEPFVRAALERLGIAATAERVQRTTRALARVRVQNEALASVDLGEVQPDRTEATIPPICTEARVGGWRATNDAVESALADYGRKEAGLQAFVALDLARVREEELATRECTGALAGVPFGVKDNMHVRGYPTLCGLRSGLNWSGDEAKVVTSLRQAGAVPFGKTALYELAFGDTPPSTTNPRDPQRLPGGSSAGSAAAVGAGIVPFALGSDTAGSVRLPAAFCGVVGFKPTFGLLPTDGMVPLCWSLDHVGVIAREPALVDAAVGAIAGWDPPPGSLSLSGVRFGIAARPFFDDLDGKVAQAVDNVLRICERAGATLIDLTVRHCELALEASSVLIAAEATSAHSQRLRELPDGFSSEVQRRLESGSLYLAVDYLQARRFLAHFRRTWAEDTRQVDAVLTPTSPTVAPLRTESVAGATRVRWIRNVVPWNLAGAPALTLPAPVKDPRTQVGIHLGGAAGADRHLIALGEALYSVLRRE